MAINIYATLQKDGGIICMDCYCIKEQMSLQVCFYGDVFLVKGVMLLLLSLHHLNHIERCSLRKIRHIFQSVLSATALSQISHMNTPTDLAI